MENSTRQVVLKDVQIDGYKRMKEILCYRSCVINTSPLGAGKTILTLKYAAETNSNLFIVAPLTVHETWKRECRKYGVDYVDIITYDKLRGRGRSREGTSCSGFLERKAIFSHSLDRDEYFYYPTEELEKYIEFGTLFVFDECHKIKNVNSIQHRAACKIVEAARGSASRCIFLSGSIADKKIFTLSICRYLFLTQETRLGNLNSGGLSDVYNLAIGVNKKLANKIAKSYHDPEDVLFELYVKIIRPIFSFYCPMGNSELKDFKNGKYNIENENYDDAVDALRDAMKNHTEWRSRFRTITKSLVLLEKIKLHKIYKLALGTLNADSNNKVCIFLWYNDHVGDMIDFFDGKYTLAVLCGATKSSDRQNAIDHFNQENNKCRVIISTTQTGGTGVSLDDTSGNYPRTAYCTPSYFSSDLYQLSGRICRANTKSVSTLRVVYGNRTDEQYLIKSLSDKGNIMLKFLGYGKNIVDIPGSFGSYNEPKERENEYETKPKVELKVILSDESKVELEETLEENLEEVLSDESEVELDEPLDENLEEVLSDESEVELDEPLEEKLPYEPEGKYERENKIDNFTLAAQGRNIAECEVSEDLLKKLLG
ncbi:MAG: hypothetical protein COA94_07150 [Rickettsiales bacterium]|nr:MAG: hypothetical protein COA94_07150 [Rickettsiales bacterium]